MTKTNRIYSKIFGYETPVYFSDSELTFNFLNECELTVSSNEMQVHLIVEDGEVFSSEGDFVCFVTDLELFGDFEEKLEWVFHLAASAIATKSANESSKEITSVTSCCKKR